MARILLVEDEFLVSETLSSVMANEGHTVVRAVNGNEGLKKYADGPFDLVITDIIMPEREGIGMILEIRRRTPNAKVVAISGGGRTGPTEFLRMAKELGAMAVMQKPIRLAEFSRVLKECLATSATTAPPIPAQLSDNESLSPTSQ
jgi:YesN/AraC family two-component response regulator